MKVPISLVLSGLLFLCTSTRAGDTQRLVVSLVDGSRINGTIESATIPFQAGFAAIDLPFAQLRSLTFSADRTVAYAEMRNGDRITGSVRIESLELRTTLGTLNLPLRTIASISVQDAGATIADGLVCYFPFDGDAKDCSENRHDGTVNSATPCAGRDGMSPGAFAFNGRGAYIEIGNSRELNFSTGGFTLSAWACFSADNDGVAIVTKHIRGYGNGFGLGVNGNRFIFRVNADPTLDAQQPSNDGRWHHVAGVYDGVTQYLYIDGTLRGSQPTGYSNFNDAPIEIGGLPEASWFTGSIDDVSIYGRALNAAEILTLYHASAGGGL